MATVHITFRNIVDLGASAVASRSPRAAQTITSSGTSQASTITALSGEIAAITAVGGPVFVAIGGTPVAASGAGDLIPDGGHLELGGLITGDKIAVINAA